MDARHAPPVALVSLAGLAAGSAWGALARVWMRFISDDPAFSWGGTLFIVGAFGIAGVALGFATGARWAGWSRRGLTAARIVGVIGLMPIFTGAGSLMMPAVVGGGLACGRRGWRRPVRAGLAVIGAVPVAVVGAGLVDSFGWSARTVLGFAWFLLIYAPVTWLAAATFAPYDGRAGNGWTNAVAMTVGAETPSLGVTSTSNSGRRS